jgi:hypothetical protein
MIRNTNGLSICGTSCLFQNFERLLFSDFDPCSPQDVQSRLMNLLDVTVRKDFQLAALSHDSDISLFTRSAARTLTL